MSTRASKILETINESDAVISSGLTKDGLKFQLFQTYATLEFSNDVREVSNLGQELFGTVSFSLQKDKLVYGYKMNSEKAEKSLKSMTPRATTLEKIANNISNDLLLRDDLAKSGDAGIVLLDYTINDKGTELTIPARTKMDRKRPDGAVGVSPLGNIVIRNQGITQLEININGSYKKIELKDLFLKDRKGFAKDIIKTLS